MGDPVRIDVDQFVLEQIDTVPHLEALLLIWNSRPKNWSVQEMAHALYLSAEQTQNLLQDLAHRNLVLASGDAQQYCYDSNSKQRDDLLEAVDRAYRRELIRISRMIHSKASPAVREFARAFRLKKDKE